ncbi:T-cell surface protein tactile [Erethizon dorsatum]
MEKKWTYCAVYSIIQIQFVRGIWEDKSRETENIYALPGSDVNLTCQLQKKSFLVQMQWSKVTNKMDMIAIYHPQHGFHCASGSPCESLVTFLQTPWNVTKWTLHLRNISSSLSGKYKCSFTLYPDGIRTRIYNLLIQAPVTQEEWRSNHTIEIEINQTLEIPCFQNISSEIWSEFTFAWLVEDNGTQETIITQDHHINNATSFTDRVKLGADYTLHLSPVQIHDDGRKFSCRVGVKPGKFLKSSTTVKVFAKPEIPMIMENKTTDVLGKMLPKGSGAHADTCATAHLITTQAAGGMLKTPSEAGILRNPNSRPSCCQQEAVACAEENGAEHTFTDTDVVLPDCPPYSSLYSMFPSTITCKANSHQNLPEAPHTKCLSIFTCSLKNVFPKANLTWFTDGQFLQSDKEELYITNEEKKDESGFLELKSVLTKMHSNKPAQSNNLTVWCIALFPVPGNKVWNTSSEKITFSLGSMNSPTDSPFSVTESTLGTPPSPANSVSLTSKNTFTVFSPEDRFQDVTGFCLQEQSCLSLLVSEQRCVFHILMLAAAHVNYPYSIFCSLYCTFPYLTVFVELWCGYPPTSSMVLIDVNTSKPPTMPRTSNASTTNQAFSDFWTSSETDAKKSVSWIPSETYSSSTLGTGSTLHDIIVNKPKDGMSWPVIVAALLSFCVVLFGLGVRKWCQYQREIMERPPPFKPPPPPIKYTCIQEPMGSDLLCHEMETL